MALPGLPSLTLCTAIITLAVVLDWRGRDEVKGRLIYAELDKATPILIVSSQKEGAQRLRDRSKPQMLCITRSTMGGY